MSKHLIDRKCLHCGTEFKARRYQIKIGTGNYCSRRCRAINQKELPLEVRFWNKVDKRSTTECWDFIGSRNEDGYGKISIGHSRVESAHRVSYRIHTGEIPVGMVVLHICDNPGCCNPAHLKLGTQADNIQDMVDKKRNVPPPIKFKLSQELMGAIRKEYTGEKGQKIMLSKKYNVAPTTITNILNRSLL